MKILRNINIAFVVILSLTLPGSAVFCGLESVTFENIRGGLYEIVGGRGARGAVFVGETGVMLIDTKMDEQSMQQVLDGIASLTDKPLLFLVNTHSDGDHVTGNRYVPENVTIIAHENCRAEFFHPLRDGKPSKWLDPALAPCLPEICFADSMTVNLGSDRIQLRHFGPGHTTGDAVVYFPGMRIAVVGDQYAGDSPPYIHAYKGGTVFGHVANLEKMLRDLDVAIYVSGHSAPVGRAAIERQIREVKERIEAIEAKLIRGDSVEDVTKGLEGRESMLMEVIYHEVKSRM
jgi:cyclase